MEFKPWPKMTRVENRRTPIFTEKIDGTNACVVIGPVTGAGVNNDKIIHSDPAIGLNVWAQSRTRFITPDDDNFGFAAWVRDNAEALLKLGEGYHFGEWWGRGIQRTYGLEERRFSLFDTRRWHNNNLPPEPCHVVPILTDVTTVEEARDWLVTNGSAAAPGWMKPEGAVMFDLDTKTPFKIIIDK